MTGAHPTQRYERQEPMSATTWAPSPVAHSIDLTLDAAERAALAALAERLARSDADLVDDPAWLDRARSLGCHAPARLREAIRRFRHDPGEDGWLLVRGLPIDPARLPATPIVIGSAQRAATVPAALAMLIGTQLGEVIAYREEKDGALVQDVLPVPGFEQSQSNAGSVPLHLHVENAFHDLRPDYVGLICLRGDQAAAAGTQVVSMRRVVDKLDRRDRAVLAQPRYRTAPPPSFRAGRAADAHPVLGGAPDDPDVRLDRNATDALDAEAAGALRRLYEVMEQATTRLVLRPGEMAVLDNRVVLHGRTSFTPRYDGTDRWLHRVYVHLDNRRTRPLRPGNGAVLS